MTTENLDLIKYRVRYFRGRVSNFNQSEARKLCFLASDWLKLGRGELNGQKQFHVLNKMG